jgi:hypothetical protein
MPDQQMIRASIWLRRDTWRLLRLVAAATEATQGEVLDRLLAVEAGRVGVHGLGRPREPVAPG